jgi:HAD superfamily hydrolase (TIGR01509 family)
MTSGPPYNAALADILTPTRHLLLDFDGPICDVYAGLPAPTVAEHLRELLTGQDRQLPANVARSDDPLEVFAYAAAIDTELAARAEAELTSLEETAVTTAKPAAYVHEVVTSARESGRTVSVVSNNSERAVNTYLTQHGLADRIDLVIARTTHDPALLKPSPHLIEKALDALSAAPSACAFVGDSTTDIEAAAIVGVPSIGYANKPGKKDRLAQAGAAAVISSLSDLVLILRARPLPS